LCIEDDKAQLLDAGFIWGKSVWDTETGHPKPGTRTRRCA